MNQLIIKLSTFILLIFLHKYYVSSTLIDFNHDSGTYQVSLKIFHDDLEKELGFNSNKLDYSNYEKTNLLITNYLKDNFKIYSNTIDFELDYLGFERKNDLLIYYIEVYNNDSKSFIVENKILFNSFKNQKNAFLNDPKSQKIGFWPFSGLRSVGLTSYCIMW